MLSSEKNIFRYSHIRHQNQFLMNNCDTVCLSVSYSADFSLFPLYINLALFSNINAAEHFNQGRFAGSVLAKQRMNLSGPKLKADILQCLNAREGFTNMLHFQQILFAHPTFHLPVPHYVKRILQSFLLCKTEVFHRVKGAAASGLRRLSGHPGVHMSENAEAFLCDSPLRSNQFISFI